MDFYRVDIQDFLVGAGENIAYYSLVQLNVAGYLETATDSADKVVIGVAVEDVDNSAGADGDLSCAVRMLVKVDINTDGLDQTDVGTAVYVKDFETVWSAGSSTNSNKAGLLLEIDVVENTGKLLLERGF